MEGEFEDRSQVLFGRAPDLAYLIKRTQEKGVTAVVGRARMGKSWLLEELARQLSQGSSPLHSSAIVALNLQEEPSYLVGLQESHGESADLLLRAVVNLYQRWLSDSSNAQKARIAWHQQKKHLAGDAAEAVSTILKGVSSLGGKPWEAVGDLAGKAFGALVKRGRELQSAGVQLQTLQSEQARDLLHLVAKLSDRKMVLVLDAWQDSQAIELEANVLENFVRHIDDWPSCHIVLGILPDEKPAAFARVERLSRLFPGAVQVFELKSMHLEEADSEAAKSRTELLQYLRNEVPATQAVADRELLEMISGYPGVLQHWTSGAKPQSLLELKKLADDANANRFSEFDHQLLRSLTEGERRLGIRLALLPASASAEDWKTLRPVVLQAEGVQAADLDGLKGKKVLESHPPPSYGHAKRREAALEWYIGGCYEVLSQQCESLVFSLADRARDTREELVPYASALAAIQPLATRMNLSGVPQGLCNISVALFRSENIEPAFLLMASRTTRQDRSQAQAVFLIGIGLNMAIEDAKKTGAADDLLEELRQLTETYCDNVLVRRCLTRSLCNMLIHSQQEGALERRDAFLQELRQLARGHSEDAGHRERLAGCLVTVFSDAHEQKTPERGKAWLDELRLLAHDHGQDAAVQEWLAKGLYNAIVFSKQHNQLDQRNRSLQEVRDLVHDHSQNAAVRGLLARCLHTVMNDAKQERNVEFRDTLLEELRTMARDHRKDLTVHTWLAQALTDAMVHAKTEQDLLRHDALLEELRRVAGDYGHDQIVRSWLARGLWIGLVNANEEKAVDRRDALFEEINQLKAKYADLVIYQTWMHALVLITDAKQAEARNAAAGSSGTPDGT